MVSITSCGDATEPIWHFRDVSGDRWHTPAKMDVLIERGKTPHRMDLLLRYDYRLDSLSVDLEVALYRQSERLRIDTLRIPLALRVGRRSRPGIAIGEVDYSVPHAFAVPYAGLYRIEVRPASPVGIAGIIGVGARLTH